MVLPKLSQIYKQFIHAQFFDLFDVLYETRYRKHNSPLTDLPIIDPFTLRPQGQIHLLMTTVYSMK